VAKKYSSLLVLFLSTTAQAAIEVMSVNDNFREIADFSNALSVDVTNQDLTSGGTIQGLLTLGSDSTGIEFQDGTTQTTAAVGRAHISTATRFSTSFTYNGATMRTETAVSTLTLTMTGGRALVSFDCTCSGGGANQERGTGFLVDGAFIDGETTTVGFKRTSHAGTQQDCGYLHLTESTFSGDTDFAFIWVTDTNTQTMNTDNQQCRFLVMEF